jgi:hypothetical protein
MDLRFSSVSEEHLDLGEYSLVSNGTGLAVFLDDGQQPLEVWLRRS